MKSEIQVYKVDWLPFEVKYQASDIATREIVYIKSGQFTDCIKLGDKMYMSEESYNKFEQEIKSRN